MKKYLLLLAVGIATTSMFSSCEKCTVCTATVGSEEVVSEFCGDSPSVDQYEKQFIDSCTNLSIPAECHRGPYD